MKPLLLVVSLAVNLALLAAFAFRPALVPPALRDFFTNHAAATEPFPANSKSSSHTVAPHHTPLWSMLASEDPATFIARLRAAGFPASIIRDLVTSEIDLRYNAHIQALTGSDPNTPFWKGAAGLSTRDPGRLEEYFQVQRERARVLRDLFNDDFFATGDVSTAQRRQFGDLPRSKIDQLQRIEDDYADMTATITAAMKGITLPADREKLALLVREKKTDFAAVLSPAELADYTVRSSPITSLLSRQLGAFEPTEAEFRAIFQVQQSLNDQFPVSISGGGISSGDFEQRRAAQQQLDQQLQATLGDARYADYTRETDREFQQLGQLAKRDNLPATNAVQAYNLRNSVAEESNRIFDDSSLAPDQKRAALQSLAQNTRSQLLATLGPTSGPAYVKVADQWLNNVERGSAVSFNSGNGSISILSVSGGIGAAISLGGSQPSYRRLPNPPPPQPNP